MWFSLNDNDSSLAIPIQRGSSLDVGVFHSSSKHYESSSRQQCSLSNEHQELEVSRKEHGNKINSLEGDLASQKEHLQSQIVSLNEQNEKSVRVSIGVVTKIEKHSHLKKIRSTSF